MDTYWHFIRDDRTLQHDCSSVVVKPGLHLTMDGEPVLCERGYHASRRALDALKYAPGAVVCKVTLGGTVIHDTNKSAATERTVMAMADATRILHEFAIWCAELALELVPEDQRDPRSLEALDTKRRWMDGQATDDELAAARAAAGDAAWAAARDAAGAAARAAAWYAARAAAGDAAWAAARDAAGAAAWAAAWAAAGAAAWYAAWAAAGDAAWAAARDAQNAELEQRLHALLDGVLVAGPDE